MSGFNLDKETKFKCSAFMVKEDYLHLCTRRDYISKNVIEEKSFQSDHQLVADETRTAFQEVDHCPSESSEKNRGMMSETPSHYDHHTNTRDISYLSKRGSKSEILNLHHTNASAALSMSKRGSISEILTLEHRANAPPMSSSSTSIDCRAVKKKRVKKSSAHRRPVIDSRSLSSQLEDMKKLENKKSSSIESRKRDIPKTFPVPAISMLMEVVGKSQGQSPQNSSAVLPTLTKLKKSSE